MTIKELEKDLNSRGGNLSGIYKITRKSDGKVYIGQSECITKRIIQHINNIRETNSDKIDGAIQSEGWENFTYEVEMYAPDLNTEQLWAMEHFCIKKYNSNVIGFNRTKGNHIGKYDHYQYSKKRHEISDELIKLISNHFGLEYAGKTVLLIGVFTDTFIKHIEFNNGKVVKLSQAFDTDEETGDYILNELKEEKIMNRKFDLIIANPPYGKIGANITKTIIDNIDYNEYINLLPANDYNRNTTKDLYKYVELDTMKPIIKGFADASVTTHMAKVSKKQRRYISFEEFQIENYIDDSLTKYFYETNNRKHYAIDAFIRPDLRYASHDLTKYTVDKCFVYGRRDFAAGHIPYTKTNLTYRWNVDESIDLDYMIKNGGFNSRHGVVSDSSQVYIVFNTAAEKQNFVEFIYSNLGFRFMAKVYTAVNTDGNYNANKVFPKVDWTRPWTVEEILKEYGYTQKEIEEVMADLVNFKGMED